MIRRDILPDMIEMLATLNQMGRWLETLNNTLAQDGVIETECEDDASAWLVGTQDAIESACNHLGAAIRALKQEDQP